MPALAATQSSPCSGRAQDPGSSRPAPSSRTAAARATGSARACSVRPIHASTAAIASGMAASSWARKASRLDGREPCAGPRKGQDAERPVILEQRKRDLAGAQGEEMAAAGPSGSDEEEIGRRRPRPSDPGRRPARLGGRPAAARNALGEVKQHGSAPHRGRRSVERAVRAALDDAAAVDDQDLVAVADRAEPMGHQDEGAAAAGAGCRGSGASVTASRALVASSSTRMLGSSARARAISSRCACPPDQLVPPSVTGAS